MIEKFRNYLIDNGYSDLTPTGKPSTATDYSNRIKRICGRENITLNELAKNIDFYVEDYGPKGNNSEYGKKSNNAYISALKQFKNFLS